MSALTKLLLTESHRKKIHEKKGGLKTPLVMRMTPHQDLDEFIVSNSKGEPTVVTNNPKGVMTNFFKLEMENEDVFHTILTDRLFVEGCERDWGGVAMMEDINQNDLDDIREFFLTYELEMFQVMCGPKGYAALHETGILVHPSGNGGVKEAPNLAGLKEWEQEHFVIGMVNERPIFLNEHLDPYIVFSAHPSFVGLLTRIDDYISVFVHNPERGVVIVRLDEESYDDNETAGSTNNEEASDGQSTEKISNKKEA